MRAETEGFFVYYPLQSPSLLLGDSSPYGGAKVFVNILASPLGEMATRGKRATAPP